MSLESVSHFRLMLQLEGGLLSNTDLGTPSRLSVYYIVPRVGLEEKESISSSSPARVSIKFNAIVLCSTFMVLLPPS
jgi:hypothetical protein